MDKQSQIIEQLAAGKECCIVYRSLEQYYFVSRLFPDLPSKPFPTAKDALTAARENQRSLGRDPENVFDATEFSKDQLAELGIK